jgi:hypothetical protein
MKRKIPPIDLTGAQTAPDKNFRESDYRETPPFCDLHVECSDSETLFYYRNMIALVDFFCTALASQIAAEAKNREPLSQLSLPFPSSTVNSFFNWLDLGRSSQVRAEWLRSKSLSQLLSLGRLGNQYAPEELLPECVESIRLPPCTPGELAADVVKFAEETKTALEPIARHSLTLLDPRALPRDWPLEVWAALLECKSGVVKSRLTQLAISVHADLVPSPALLQAVLHDIFQVDGAAERPVKGAYWAALNLREPGAGRAQGVWLHAILGTSLGFTSLRASAASSIFRCARATSRRHKIQR